MGSKTFEGVWFAVFSHDHAPPHVHGRYGGVLVIVDLLQDGKVRQSARWNAIQPSGAKKSDVRRILRRAAAHAAELMELWENTHGPASE